MPGLLEVATISATSAEKLFALTDSWITPMREDSALRRSGAETFRLSATVSLATAEVELEVTPGAESDL